MTALPQPAADPHDDDDDELADDARPDAEIFELRSRPDPELDKISVLLQAPVGAAPPTFPDVAQLDHRGIRDRMLADVLDDALGNLAIRWD